MSDKPTEEKIYTQSDMDGAINATRIEERYIANQLMGDLGIPADRRIAPNGQPIYVQAADIVMRTMLRQPQKEETQPPSDQQ